jgi:peptidoglycan hydrolase CwlO-like protein
MKKILIILMTLCFSTAFSQVTKPKIEYPRYEVDSLGQKIVTMTIQQAMKLDNDSELLSLFKRQSLEMADYETLCIKVISDKDDVIAKLNISIGRLDNQLTTKDQKITTLQNEILEYVKNNGILQAQVDNRQKDVDEKNKQLIKLKTKMVIGGGLGGMAVVSLLLVIIGVIR